MALTLPKTIRHRWRLWVLVFVLVCFASITLYLTLVPNGRAHAKSALLVLDLLLPSNEALLRQVTTPAYAESVKIHTTSGNVEAQYYRPTGNGPHGALILVLGYPSNIEDLQLNRLAENLARLGIAVLVPRLPGLSTGKLVEDDVDVLVNAFQWLVKQPEIAPDHVGFGGFCVGSSLALLAAEDPRINEEVALVNVFGGYYDLQTFMRATAVHSAQYQGEEYPWQPSEQTVALYTQNVLGYLDNADDQAILKQYFTGGTAELEYLTPGGRLAYGLLTSTDAQEVDALLAQIPPQYQNKIASVSPSAGIGRLQAKVFIMHDISDPYVPVTESYRLANAIFDPGQKVQAEFVLFEHVRPNRALDRLTLFREGVRLIFYLGRLLAEITPA